MTTIRSDSRVSSGSGNHSDHPYSYVAFERVLDALEDLRHLAAAYGHYGQDASGRETFNLGLRRRGPSASQQADGSPTGLALAFALSSEETPTQSPPRKSRQARRPRVRLRSASGARLMSGGGLSERLRATDGGPGTLNALARALADGYADAEGRDLPLLTGGWLPEAFCEQWLARAPEGSDEALWGQGAARALTEFNLGTQVHPLKLLPGDVIQLGADPERPLLSQPGYVYAVRRFRSGEVRFLYLSSQPDTFGLGVPLNDLARRALAAKELGLVLRANLATDTGEVLAEARFEVEVAGQVFPGKSDAEGKLEVALPSEALTGILRFWIDEGSEDEEQVEWPLRFAPPAGQEPEEREQRLYDLDAEARGAGEGGEAEEDPFDAQVDPTLGESEQGPQDDAEQPTGVSRLEWIVSRSGEPEALYVYHPDPFLDARFVTHALRYGKWQVLTPGEEDRFPAFYPWRGASYVTRPHREFPRYPIKLFGSNDLAYSVPSEGGVWEEVSVDDTTSRYYRNTERLNGGYFPIGRSRTWHSGVHLEPDPSEPQVYAPLDGRIVAARLCDPGELRPDGSPRFGFGSPNFVLLKHGLSIGGSERTFFTLLMHLDPTRIELQGESRTLSPEAASVPWLRDLALAPDSAEDRLLLDGLSWDSLYLRVVRPPTSDYRLAPEPKEGEEPDPEAGTLLREGDLLEVAGPAVNEVQWQIYNGNKAGEVKLLRDGSSGFLDPAAFLERGGILEPVDAYPLRHAELKERLLAGEVVDLSELEIVVRCGEVVGQVGLWNGARRLHVEVFSADLLPLEVISGRDDQGQPSWTTKAQPDADGGSEATGFLDRPAFLDAFFEAIEERANEAFGLDGQDQAVRVRERMLRDAIAKEDAQVVLEGEVQAFFQDPTNSLLPLFRSLVVRHLSEWGSKVQWSRLEEARAQLGEPLAERLKALGEALEEYVWWSEGFAKDAGLPSDQIAHYYHPVTFWRWIEKLRVEELAAGQGSVLHESVLDLNHDLEVEGGEAPPETGTQLLKLNLVDEDGDPLEGCRYVLRVLDEEFTGQSAEGGRIEHEVPAEAVEGELEFWPDPDDEEESYLWPLRIG